MGPSSEGPTAAEPPRLWDAVLFDLDGTLVDSAGAITRSVAAALRAVGVAVPDAEDLLAYVGPPLRVGLTRIAGLDERDVERAVAAYREIYGGGALLDVDPFPGVPRLLDDLADRGYPVAVATSKDEGYARRILAHLGLDRHLAAVAGARPDGGGDKSAVVARAVRSLADLGHATRRVVLVGDREHDVAGAARWGIPCIVVGWGYGGPEEFAGAHAVVHTVGELAEALGAG